MKKLSLIAGIAFLWATLALGQQYPSPTFGSANITGLVGTTRPLNFQTGSSLRWALRTTGNAESGGNAGSNLSIARFDDTGVFIDTPLNITRSTGVVSLSQPLPVTSGGTGAITAPAARTSLGAAASGANSDITSLTGLTTPLTIGQGGTGTALGPVVTFNTRRGAVVPAAGDYTTAQLTTSTSASAPAVGTLGEVISCSAGVGSAVTLTTGTATNVPTCNPLALTAGNWACTGNVVFNVLSTNTNLGNGWVSQTSATVPTLPNAGAFAAANLTGLTTATVAITVAPFYVRSAGSTNVYLSGSASFTGTAPTMYGAMNCQRTN